MVFVEGYKLTYLAAVVVGLLVLSFWGGTRLSGGERKEKWYGLVHSHIIYVLEWNRAWVRSTASEHTPFSQSLGINDLS